MKILKHLKKRFWFYFIVLAVMANALAAFHAYRFVHFTGDEGARTKKPEELSWGERIYVMITGINNPRPVNETSPSTPFETIVIKGKWKTEAWLISVDGSKGTVVIGHGYLGSKSSMLDRAEAFQKLGYNTLLLDFLGSGGSEGNFTSLGYFESEQISDVVKYLEDKGEKNIVLYGSSMGAVSIMKAAHEADLPVNGLILECPFSTMRKTVANRFHEMGVPAFPMSDLLVFWGAVFGEFNAFDHNPVEYAESVDMPVLLMSGAIDRKVEIKEIDEIYENLKGKKSKKIFPETGHENYLTKNREEWTKLVDSFLSEVSQP